MLNQKAVSLGKNRSVIREIFEYAKKRGGEIGKENVFDFSLGNPSVPAPACVNEQLCALTREMPSVLLHGYTSAQGDASVRAALSAYIRDTFGADVPPDLIYMTCGAAASLTISLKALCNAGDEVLTFAPYFTEYKVFAENAGATFRAVPTKEGTFQIDIDLLQAALTERTKAVIINSPNNPSGVVYGEETIRALAAALKEASARYHHPVYLLSDEPYRELVYDAATKVPYVMNEYENSLVLYSFSKSLSLPGERIGYIAVNPRAENAADVYAAVCGAGRSLGYVCAPALFQYLIVRCLGQTADLEVYRANRDALCNALSAYGYTFAKPEGAFYLFVKSPEPDAAAFCERAKKYELLFVPSDDFGVPGYVRIAYCVSPDMIARSLPAFRLLMEEYKKEGN